jgi:hypothetical protein
MKKIVAEKMISEKLAIAVRIGAYSLYPESSKALF